MGAHGVTFVGLKLFIDDDMPSLDAFQWILLIFGMIFFAYVEGYRGFYKAWSPWVARRSLLLGRAVGSDGATSCFCSPGKLVTGLLAPFAAMGFFLARPKR